MTTVADAIAETRGSFFTSFRPAVNYLNAGIDDSQVTIDLADDVGPIQAGADVCVDLEIMRVRRVTGSTATVVRGWNGSTAATHGVNSQVWVNPQVSNFDIFRALRNDIVDLSAPSNGLFKVTTYDFNFVPTVQGYEIPIADIIGVADVRFRQTGPWKSWPEIRSYRFDQTQATSDFPSGNSITLYEGGYPGQPVHVVLMVPFVVPTGVTSDLQTDVGLPGTANDLPPLGAVMRLAAGREIQRNFNEHQGQPRRQEEVPAGSNLGAYRDIVQLRQTRIQTEANRLKNTYPMYQKGRF